MRQTLSLASCLFGVIVVTFVLSIKSLHDDDNPRQSAIHHDHDFPTRITQVGHFQTKVDMSVAIIACIIHGAAASCEKHR